MSDDLINQLTLNFLISKNQLQKLNKRTKENAEEIKLLEIRRYKERINTLFNNLLDNNPPDDLLYNVKTTFDSFLEKSIYYFKAHDNSENLEKERCDEIHDDFDYDKEEKEIENGNYKERSNDKADEQEDDEEQDDEQEDEHEEEDEVEENEEDNSPKIQTNKTDIQRPVLVRSKYRKPTNSVGVDDIQKLPLDWFQNVRKDYIKNNIIPRTKNK